MKEHHKKCNGATSKESSEKEQENATPFPKKSKQEHVSTKVRSYRIQSSMSNFIVKTNSREKDALDEAIAKFFYSCNIPFLVSENPSFINMLNLLRPGYEPPPQKKTAGWRSSRQNTQSVAIRNGKENQWQKCFIVTRWVE